MSYLSTKYSKIARVSLDADQTSASYDGLNQDLPNDEIVVMMVDDSGNAAVGIDLQVFRSLVFLLAEIEVHRFICQPKFFKYYGDFPKNRIEFR